MSPTTDPVVLFVPLNAPGTLRHGGARREAQVAELVVATGLPFDRLYRFPTDPSRFRRAVTGLHYSRSLLGATPTGLGSLRRCVRFGSGVRSYLRVLAGYPAARVLVLEHTRDHLGLIYAARLAGLKVVCVPHDLEALTARRCRHGDPLDRLGPLHAELAALGRADAVYTISLEEQWLLRGFGIDADHLPYHPTAADRTVLEAVRAERASGGGTEFLVIGSAIHRPTLEGMAELIGWLGGLPDRAARTVTLAGYGTEALGAIARANGVIVRGAVSEEELGRLYRDARAVIVHQRFGCGALTRVPELLLAGIPVLANTIAARSFHGYSGVNVYGDRDELAAMLTADMDAPPRPARPVAAETRFVRDLTHWAAT